jgi:hypothetical protein
LGLKQQIINHQIEDISARQSVSDDQAFLIYIHSLIMGKGPASFDQDDNVDGGRDKQIDAFTIEEGNGRADIYLTQATTSQSFSSTKLVQLGSGLKWIFEVGRKEIDKLPNQAFKDKIIQLRETRSELGPTNLSIHVSFAANGETKILSDEFLEEKRRIESEYDNGVFERFSLSILGVDEIIELSKAKDRRTRSVDTNLKMKYDANTPSLMSYRAQGHGLHRASSRSSKTG